jgi:hypothetical protein
MRSERDCNDSQLQGELEQVTITNDADDVRQALANPFLYRNNNN